MARVAVGPEDLARCITQARPEAARASAEISWVLVKHDGEDSLRHVVANRTVGKNGRKIVRAAQHALAERRIRPGQLSFSAKQRSESERTAVERVESRDVKLLTRRHRFIWHKHRRGAEIRNDPEDSFGLGLPYQGGWGGLLAIRGREPTHRKYDLPTCVCTPTELCCSAAPSWLLSPQMHLPRCDGRSELPFMTFRSFERFTQNVRVQASFISAQNEGRTNGR